MSNHKRVILLTFMILSMVLTVRPSQMARAAATFVVNDAGDDGDFTPNGICETGDGNGVCTLRAAIEEANNEPGIDTIKFALSSPYTISPSTPFDSITESLIIDGKSQSGFSLLPIIQLNGGSAGGGADGLKITDGSLSVYSLNIRNFSGDGITLASSAGGSIIQGNLIGVDKGGNNAAPNDVGIRISDSPSNTIGGTVLAEANLISGNGTGIIIEGAGSTDNVVTLNFIGLNLTRRAVIANTGVGILIDGAADNIIGGAGFGSINYISGNGSHGISIVNAASGNEILGNLIGGWVEKPGFGNGGHGIEVDASDNQIGGLADLSGNGIAFNILSGVAVLPAATGVSILGNYTSFNGALGIDLGDDGVTGNDNLDGDTGANNLQNYPVITSVLLGGTFQINGSFNSLASQNYLIEIFVDLTCDGSDYGEGLQRIHSFTAFTNSSGDYLISENLSFGYLVGYYITATATLLDPDDSTPIETSEFSLCRQITAGPTNTPAPTATYSGGGGGATATSPINTPTPSITGTPPTATLTPTITPNFPQQTLTQLATIIMPTPTSTFSPFISVGTPTVPTASATFNLTNDIFGRGTPTATPTSVSLLTVGQLTATAEAEGSLGQIAGIEISSFLYACGGLIVLLLLAGGGFELVRWINSRREDEEVAAI